MKQAIYRRSIGLFFSLALLSACGHKDEPPPAPAPPPAPGSPAAPGGLGGNLEDALPGTPLSQTNYRESRNALDTNLGALGTLTISSANRIDYIVNMGYPRSTFSRIGNPTPDPNPSPSGFVRGYGDSLQLYFRRDGGWAVSDFQFQYEVELYGLVLTSTDQVALFESYGSSRSRQILKVAYKTQNPAMQLFIVEEVSSGGGGGWAPYNSHQNGGGQLALNVVQKALATAFQYQQPAPR